MLRRTSLVLMVGLCFGLADVSAQRNSVLRGVKTVKVTETTVPNPDKVKEDFAATLIQDSLRNAFRSANFEISEEAPVTAHFVLDEFTSGSKAKRLLVGFGSGRSTVDGRFVVQDATGKELANVRLRVRGNLWGSGYQGNERQRQQATSALDQRFLEEIARLK